MEFHELQMGSMTNHEYTSRFLELLRYAPYLKDEKAKIQRFINGFPTTYRERIEFNEARSLEESIWKLKHYYEKSKRKDEAKHDLKANEKVKGKWPPIDKVKDVEDAKILKRYLVLQQFQNVFLAEIPEFPPHREVDFSIELVPGETPT
eukprot:PITA_33935